MKRFFMGLLMLLLLTGFVINGGAAEIPANTQQEVLPQETVTGWVSINGRTSYLDGQGNKLTGLQKIDGKTYYFSKKGTLKTGWIRINKKKYYFDPNDGGARASGFLKIGSHTYYFRKNGRYATGWYKPGDGKRYYFSEKGYLKKGWRTIDGNRYYFDKKTGAMAVGKVTIKGNGYYFSRKGLLKKKKYDTEGNFYDADGKKLQRSTVRDLLKTALEPVGATMYVWGGGWNKEDTGAGMSARTIGVSAKWKQFFEQQTAAYDYHNTRYQIENGLDCSGYIGWVVYNAFNTVSGNAGYVMKAEIMAQTFAGYGWGAYTPAGSVKDYKAGDIMSTSAGHVYMVLGSCEDGSVVLLHASPAGTMISGTATPSGNAASKAVALATQYMQTYYPKWYAKYPKVSRPVTYLTNYAQMRWNVTGTKRMLSDPDGYHNKTAEEILKDLFK